MVESQNIEWKEAWRDEYLKWICGFANAQGGKIYIGINDSGKVIGIKNGKKLLEEIPNKIQTNLGFLANVNLLSENDLEYIEIVVRFRFGLKRMLCILAMNVYFQLIGQWILYCEGISPDRIILKLQEHFLEQDI